MVLVAVPSADQGEPRGARAQVASVAGASPPVAVSSAAQYRLQIEHDIRHELGTILLLASMLAGSKDVGPSSRARASQIISEARWLEELVGAYEGAVESAADHASVPDVRVDAIVAEIVRSIRLSSRLRIRVDGDAICARVNRLALWRALRNVIVNAVDAAGPDGTVIVRVSAVGGHAVVVIDDDGPGFDPRCARPSALGLTITAEMLEGCGGTLRIGRSDLGGCRVQLSVPQASVPQATA
jgi:signal transduction histidine kinase